MPPNSVSQGQGQDSVNLLSTSHVSYESYDIDGTLDASANMISHDQAKVNRYLQNWVAGMNDKMTIVTAGIQSLRESLTQLINQQSRSHTSFSLQRTITKHPLHIQIGLKPLDCVHAQLGTNPI